MPGFLGTRADLLSDLLILALGLIGPALVLGVVLARRRHLPAHRAVMIGVFAVLVAYVVVYEANLMLLGGIPWLLRTTRLAPAAYFALVAPHVLVSTVALVLGALAIRAGSRAFASGAAFAPRHRAVAWWGLGTLAVSVVSGVGVYWATFVAG